MLKIKLSTTSSLPSHGGSSSTVTVTVTTPCSPVSRTRHRSLRKSAAIEEEGDIAYLKHEVTESSFSSLSGVPRLVLPSPSDASPSLSVPLPTPFDSSLLLVPSPVPAYKISASPDQSRQNSTEMPSTGSDLLSMGVLNQNVLNSLLGHTNGLNVLNHLTGGGGEKKLPMTSEMGESDELSVELGRMHPSAFSQSPNHSIDISNFSSKMDPLTLHQLSSTSTDVSMPNKSIVQEDVRTGGGRYQLVRKRGRSEVWNLFGQVVDIVTGSKLPYVACYACKVLYTDTGGGTGNMTRHRCPLGSSFRSMAGSSSDTFMHNSFDSGTSRRRSASPEAKREKATTIMPQHSADDVYGSPTTANSAMLSSQLSGESLSEVDRESLSDAAVRCSAMELIDPATFVSRGFRELALRILQIGRKSNVSIDKPADLFPDVNHMLQAIDFMVKEVKEDLKSEMRELEEVVLAVERATIQGERIVVWLQRIRRSVIAVYPIEDVNDESGAIVRALADYSVPAEKPLRIVAPLGTLLPYAHPNTILYPDIIHLLNKVVNGVVEGSAVLSSAMMSLQELTSMCSALEILPFYSPDWIDLQYITKLYRMSAGWIGHTRTVRSALAGIGHEELCERVDAVDWEVVAEAVDLFEPFHEALVSISTAQPNINKVIPEWEGLLHECEESTRWGKEAAKLLREFATSLSSDHRIAALLNPKLTRKLPSLFSHQHKEEAMRRVRDLCGLERKEPKEAKREDPHSRVEESKKKKRSSFLSALEHEQSDDELEQFLSGQFHEDRSKELLTFWSSYSSREQSHRLPSLARRLLAVPACSPTCYVHRKVASATSSNVASLLILRAAYESS